MARRQGEHGRLLGAQASSPALRPEGRDPKGLAVKVSLVDGGLHVAGE